jgi:DNA-binding NarL/FixJ family response regulator
MRRGIRALLERRPDFQVVAEAGDGREAVELTETHSPHVVVADIAGCLT